jgi:hypothetical protein
MLTATALCIVTPQPQFYTADQYAKRLVGNAYSIPVVDIILRKLQGMFASKRYEGYTYAFEWKESGPEINNEDVGDDSKVSDEDEARLVSPPVPTAAMASSNMPSRPSQTAEDEDGGQDPKKKDQKPAEISCVVVPQSVCPKMEDHEDDHEDQKPPAAHDDDDDNDDNVVDEKKES